MGTVFSHLDRFWKSITRFTRLPCGTVTIMTAIMMPMIIGLSSLSIDYGVWLYEKRQLQKIADIAAIGGAMAIKTGKMSQVTAYVTADASNNGFTVGGGNVIKVSSPPTTGAYVGNSAAVEVILEKQAKAYLSSMYMINPPTLHATSVSLVSYSKACVVTLGNAEGATLNGNGAINSPDCGLYVNSKADSAVTTNGNGSITTTSVMSVGGVSGSGITASEGIFTGTAPAADPYSNLTMPSAGSCTENNYQTSGVSILSPGTYCGGLNLKANANVTLLPGTYVVNGGSFSVNGQATLSGVGVTIVLTGSSGDYASISINAGANVTLSAPLTGSMASILVFGDRNAIGVIDSFGGGATNVLSGIIYAPSSDLKMSGNALSGGLSCTQIVANSLTVSGTSYFGGGCTSSEAMSVGNVTLAE